MFEVAYQLPLLAHQLNSCFSLSRAPATPEAGKRVVNAFLGF